MKRIRYNGLAHHLDLYITAEDKVIVFSPLLTYSETIEFPLLEADNGAISSDSFPTSQSSRTNSISKSSYSLHALGLMSPDSGSDTLSQVRGKVLQFSPSDGHFEHEQQYDDYAPTIEKYVSEIKVYGLVGILDFGFSKFLFYIKRRRIVATIAEKSVFQIVEGGYVTIYRKSYLTLSEEQIQDEGVKGVLSLLSSGQMYFSYEYDLTNSTQALTDKLYALALPKSQAHAPPSVFISELCNETFWWNRYLQAPFLERREEFKEFIMPIVCGYVGQVSSVISLGSPYITPPSDTASLYPTAVDIYLIARMSSKRVGTRYNRRGLDNEGNSAIYVESELIVRTPTHVASFVLIRGSVPWLWRQLVQELEYKPPLSIEPLDSANAKTAMRKHFEILQDAYGGEISCLNLLNQEGFELPLGNTYRRGLEDLLKSGAVRDVNYHGISLNPSKQVFGISIATGPQGALLSLLESTRPWFDKQHFFMATVIPSCQMTDSISSEKRLLGLSPLYSSSLISMEVLGRQAGVFRVNCLDCLDRTNMVQFLLANSALLEIMQGLGAPKLEMLASEFYMSDLKMLLGKQLTAYRKMWVAHGDAISTQYAGTGALHSSFIESGPRSFSRPISLKNVTLKLSDGFKSVGRFYLNQFADSYKQDNYDVFLGQNRDGLSSLDFSQQQQTKQRKQSISPLITVLNEHQKQDGLKHSLRSALTAGLILLLRHASPKSLNSWFDFVAAAFWMAVIWAWSITIGKREHWSIARKPKNV